MDKAEETRRITKEEWKVKSTEMFACLNEEGKGKLSNYIIERGLILEFLQKHMEMMGNGNFEKEEVIHQVIFPMKTTSGEVDYKQHNLWIIDERLSYHYYLASDKVLKSTSLTEAPNPEEPSILIFDRPIALIDRAENEKLESIVILEFKRPGKSPMGEQKTPVDHVLEYVERIIVGRAESRKGSLITITEGTHFFCYVICELDPPLKKLLRRKTMRETPDGRGMFTFFPDHRAYVEVISYDKMLDDAKKRNEILLEKLQLPLFVSPKGAW